jgi:alpha-1,2-mannosyltransferase
MRSGVDQPDPSSPASRGRVRLLRRFTWTALVGLAVFELAASARVYLAPTGSRDFPQDYVSQGAWSAGAWVRPLKRQATDVAPALTAARRMLDREPNLYDPVQRVGPSFIYPPTAALELLPLASLVRGDELSRATQAMDLAARLCALATLATALAFAWRAAADWPTRAGLLVAFAAFYPTRWMLTCVQAQSLITLFLALAMMSAACRRDVLTGVLLGLAAGLKPHLGLLLVFGVVRRQWGLCAGMAGSLLALGGLSVALAGFEPWRVYVTEVLPAVSAGYAYYPNQSINGVLNRWMGHPAGFEIAPRTTVVTIGSAAATLLFAVLAVWPRGAMRGVASRAESSNAAQVLGAGTAAHRTVRSAGLMRAIDLGIALLCATLASPVAWEHHYAWCVVLFGACLAAAVEIGGPRVRGRVVALLAVSYVGLGAYIAPLTAGAGGPATLLDALPLFAALMLLGVAGHLALRLAGEEAGRLEPRP